MSSRWSEFQLWYCACEEIGLSLDVSRMQMQTAFVDSMKPRLTQALEAMKTLESGAIANPDEHRMVGHYWLRAPELAPTADLTRAIIEALANTKSFSSHVHNGTIKGATGKVFTNVISIGIGGSALGPQFVADALGDCATDKLKVTFLDNTDPEGFQRVLSAHRGKLDQTLVVVISKSGSTPETANGMLAMREEFQKQGIPFAKHAVAITGDGSKLDKLAQSERWLARFPMWDWVGGRTSECSTVGLVPAALQGLDIDGLLAGAKACDEVTRRTDWKANPAALLALAWYSGTDGKGAKDMVILPYKDRLLLLSRYLQQLIMESLGKQLDLGGKRVEQGIAVYGNKGSTDQHAYVQQLRDGVNNFFATFIRVLAPSAADPLVEPNVTAGDYLHGFFLGTREALSENGRSSITITIDQVNARSIGVLIALFERAVGLYASMIGINAYHQPGVEAGKKAAAAALALQTKVLGALDGAPQTAEQIAAKIDASADVESIYLLLEYLAATGRAVHTAGTAPSERAFARP
jgi:glucose-6-phosphate isomerase